MSHVGEAGERPRESWGWDVWRRIFGAVALLGALLGAWHAVPITFRSWASARWPTTEGLVEELEFSRKANDEGQDTYGMSITYSYSVDGQPHRASRRRFGYEPALSLSAKTAAESAFAPGTALGVAYDPEQPDDAVLEPGPSLASHVQLLASLAGALMGAALLAPRRPLP